ncbi:hypothetical protein EO98_08935 [Methanosarcina sp. 2.H.T.1A.6]|nr:hypothetical protein EO94_13880 [Methanosarcina sp. 2.H.T.1A.3]KKG21422.1 hypothetical protein EO98_08935 [Methanosarcina sp. 2.H.T.1A.6]KKG25264.1 hypothetical protein EO96_10455 [Methanosarcina sp. 2.H.T.1A.8]KKG25922.1 hypothetical protein EO97_09210 [Methanosarcina sp. 2.H.T.1A.15]
MGFSSELHSLKRTKLQIFMTNTTSFAVLSRFCHARRRRAAFRQKRREKTKKRKKRESRSKSERQKCVEYKQNKYCLQNTLFQISFLLFLYFFSNLVLLSFFDRPPDKLAETFYNL